MKELLGFRIAGADCVDLEAINDAAAILAVQTIAAAVARRNFEKIEHQRLWREERLANKCLYARRQGFRQADAWLVTWYNEAPTSPRGARPRIALPDELPADVEWAAGTPPLSPAPQCTRCGRVVCREDDVAVECACSEGATNEFRCARCWERLSPAAMVFFGLADAAT
jgi:hypothetical protein